ncbi:MAG: carboxypeptidase regulatory-like domain-containing protein [bacterium]
MVFSFLVSSPAVAQRASGLVRDTTTSGPLSGAVVSVMDANSHVLARTISDAAGRYAVDVPGDATLLRAVRIGFRPRTVVLAPPVATPRVIDLWLARIPTMLTSMAVNEEGLCATGSDRSAALALWEQARTGLLASVVAREALPAQASMMTYERVTDLNPGRVLQQTHRTLSGRTVRPFQAADAPGVLAEQGYLELEGASRRYKAPDADVLLDESFARTHCFAVRDADRDHPGLLGLAFEPTRGREAVVDVRGTLWLDPGAPELRQLEFGYVGAGASLERDGAAGVIHFRAMSNGVAFVDEWNVRIPMVSMPAGTTVGGQARVSREGTFDAGRQKPRVVQTSLTGGMVLNARWPDGLTFASPLEALTGVVTEKGSATPLDAVLVTLAGTADTVTTDSLGRFSIYPAPPGRYSYSISDTALSSFLAARSSDGEVNVSAGVLAPLHLELPSRVRALRAVCPDDPPTRTTSLLVGRLIDNNGGTKAPRAVRIFATWLRESGMAPSAAVSAFKQEEQAVEVDDAGRFAFCGVPRERSLRITASRYGQRFADTTMQVGALSEVESLDWRLNVRALAQLEPVPPARLGGRVITQSGGGPVVGAELWLPMLDRRTKSDSSGVFVLDSLPPGRMLLQIRHLGFASRRDTLTLASGVNLTREYALASQAAVLDTVKTVADQVRYISPALRGFEERRTHQVAGYFIPEVELRKYDDSPVTSVLLSRASGLKLIPGFNGKAFIASTRKCGGAGFPKGICGPCFVTTYIDGVRVYNMANDSHDDPMDFNRMPVNQLAAVEFYPSTATGPPEFNATGSGCGLLLLWTRER